MLGITGATGRLGGRVARRLAAAGVEQRLLVRDPRRAPQLPGATAVPLEYGIGSAAQAAAVEALRGVAVLFMVSAGESTDRVARHTGLLDAAVTAGVGQVVYTSFVGAGPTATFTLVRDHGATEAHLHGTGLAWTVLRDNLYADFLPQMVGDDGVLRGPAGNGRVAAVAQDDIADAAAAVLLAAAEHAGRTYELTGPEAFTLEEAAQQLSMASGRQISYYPESLEEAYASRSTYGAPDWQVEAWVSTYTAIAAGELSAVTRDVERLSGHPATSLAQLLSQQPDAG